MCVEAYSPQSDQDACGVTNGAVLEWSRPLRIVENRNKFHRSDEEVPTFRAALISSGPRVSYPFLIDLPELLDAMQLLGKNVFQTRTLASTFPLDPSPLRNSILRRRTALDEIIQLFVFVFVVGRSDCRPTAPLGLTDRLAGGRMARYMSVSDSRRLLQLPTLSAHVHPCVGLRRNAPEYSVQR